MNQAGERFVDESIPKKDVGDHVLEQPGGIGYCIYDEETRKISLKTARNNGSVLESEERGLVCKGSTVKRLRKKPVLIRRPSRRRWMPTTGTSAKKATTRSSDGAI